MCHLSIIRHFAHSAVFTHTHTYIYILLLYVYIYIYIYIYIYFYICIYYIYAYMYILNKYCACIQIQNVFETKITVSLYLPFSLFCFIVGTYSLVISVWDDCNQSAQLSPRLSQVKTWA